MLTKKKQTPKARSFRSILTGYAPRPSFFLIVLSVLTTHTVLCMNNNIKKFLIEQKRVHDLKRQQNSLATQERQKTLVKKRKNITNCPLCKATCTKKNTVYLHNCSNGYCHATCLYNYLCYQQQKLGIHLSGDLEQEKNMGTIFPINCIGCGKKRKLKLASLAKKVSLASNDTCYSKIKDIQPKTPLDFFKELVNIFHNQQYFLKKQFNEILETFFKLEQWTKIYNSFENENTEIQNWFIQHSEVQSVITTQAIIYLLRKKPVSKPFATIAAKYLNRQEKISLFECARKNTVSLKTDIAFYKEYFPILDSKTKEDAYITLRTEFLKQNEGRNRYAYLFNLYPLLGSTAQSDLIEKLIKKPTKISEYQELAIMALLSADDVQWFYNETPLNNFSMRCEKANVLAEFQELFMVALGKEMLISLVKGVVEEAIEKDTIFHRSLVESYFYDIEENYWIDRFKNMLSTKKQIITSGEYSMANWMQIVRTAKIILNKIMDNNLKDKFIQYLASQDIGSNYGTVYYGRLLADDILNLIEQDENNDDIVILYEALICNRIKKPLLTRDHLDVFWNITQSYTRNKNDKSEELFNIMYKYLETIEMKQKAIDFYKIHFSQRPFINKHQEELDRKKEFIHTYEEWYGEHSSYFAPITGFLKRWFNSYWPKKVKPYRQ